ncbi:MAG TPA: patatin-like phospholipase family protein [Micromonosporaceae bacterium]|nr:patatin-like phospholipase family protein [Micromonosporaceae bacterium]
MAGRALVLGGGGVTGIAWEIGMLAGLAEAGVDLSAADLVIGTSAGSVVAVLVRCGIPMEKLYDRQLADSRGEIADRLSRRAMASWAWASLRSRDPQTAGARIGRLALTARTAPEAERRTVIESRLPTREWPPGRLLITAVDAATGEFATFHRDCGVPLVDAVAASCAVPGVWPPVTIDGRRYIDGGVRSPANVDLAAGFERVVVVAPIARGAGAVPSVARQVRALGPGSRVAVVTPDAAARRAFGNNLLDPARRAPAARAGRAQAPAQRDAVREVWGG